MNEEGAMEIVHATLQASYVNSVPNIEPADDVHSNHVVGSPSSSDDSAFEFSFILQVLLVRFEFWRRVAVVSYWYWKIDK